jgi:hypothetical protein
MVIFLSDLLPAVLRLCHKHCHLNKMLWGFFKGGLLVVNGFAILNEERFLSLYDLHVLDQGAADQGQLKAQVAGFLHAVRYLRLPLVALDIFTILMIVFFG